MYAESQSSQFFPTDFVGQEFRLCRYKIGDRRSDGSDKGEQDEKLSDLTRNQMFI